MNQMNPYLATGILSAALLCAGGAFFAPGFRGRAFSFLRSQNAAYLFCGAALLWFMWILYNLSEADFGQYKFILMAVFGGAGILAFRHLPDFLPVRGLSVIILLFMRVLLDALYGMPAQSRLVSVSLAYVLVVAFVYFGCLPFRMRDFFEWLYERSVRVRAFAASLCLAGAVAAGSMLFY